MSDPLNTCSPYPATGGEGCQNLSAAASPVGERIPGDNLPPAPPGFTYAYSRVSHLTEAEWALEHVDTDESCSVLRFTFAAGEIDDYPHIKASLPRLAVNASDCGAL